jgi:hypothetical protein
MFTMDNYGEFSVWKPHKSVTFYIVRTSVTVSKVCFIVCTLQKILLIKKYKIGKTCSVHGEDENYVQNLELKLV